jgi:hypothetical protein
MFRALMLEGLLKQMQVFSFLVEPFLQLANLLELCSLIRKELSLGSLGRKLDMGWRMPSCDWLLFL